MECGGESGQETELTRNYRHAGCTAGSGDTLRGSSDAASPESNKTDAGEEGQSDEEVGTCVRESKRCRTPVYIIYRQ